MGDVMFGELLENYRCGLRTTLEREGIDPFEFIAATSRYITLRPGDVLWLGTDETVAMVPGQLVEVSIDGLGTLANPVIEEKPE